MSGGGRDEARAAVPPVAAVAAVSAGGGGGSRCRDEALVVAVNGRGARGCRRSTRDACGRLGRKTPPRTERRRVPVI